MKWTVLKGVSFMIIPFWFDHSLSFVYAFLWGEVIGIYSIYLIDQKNLETSISEFFFLCSKYGLFMFEILKFKLTLNWTHSCSCWVKMFRPPVPHLYACVLLKTSFSLFTAHFLCFLSSLVEPYSSTTQLSLPITYI